MTESAHHGMKDFDGLNPYCRMSLYGDEHLGGLREDRFGRLFPELNPAYTRPDILETIGARGGPMDAGGGNDLTDDVELGQIFFGQFVDHDITLDASTTFDSVVESPGGVENLRTPTLDLDCVYGLGPEAQPYLFNQDRDPGDPSLPGPFAGVKLLTGADNSGQPGLAEHDLLRSPNGRAIIGDPRNDENRIISQMQLAIIRFHNHVADTLNSDEGLAGHDLYEEARKQTTWHYQWAIVNDFLPAICGRPVVERILGCGREHYCGNVPFIPIEFSVAAYRFGHSMIPQRLQIREGGEFLDLFGSLGLGFDAVTQPEHLVDWHELFRTSEGRGVTTAQQLDTKVARTLLELPFVNGTAAEKSLAVRNLLRGNTFLLPGGEKVAEAIGREQSEIDDVAAKIADLSGEIGADGIPLWLYLLAEAEVVGRAETVGTFKPREGLGPVGATIVAEVLIGLLELDDRSYLGANRNWGPNKDWDTLGKLLTVAQPALPAI